MSDGFKKRVAHVVRVLMPGDDGRCRWCNGQNPSPESPGHAGDCEAAALLRECEEP